MTITFRDDGAWGTGKGTPLTHAEVDENFYTLEQTDATHAALTTAHGVSGNIVGTTSTQTLTNKTLTSPTINTPTIATPDITNGNASGLTLTSATISAGNISNVNISGSTLTTATLTSPTITTPTIASFVNATHNHSSNATGGTLTYPNKSLVSSNDTTAGYLNGKLVAGSGVTLTEGSDGGNETLTVASKVGVVATAATASDASIVIPDTGVWTDIITGVNLGTITAGEIYLIAFTAFGLKGATPGLSAFQVKQASGSANFRVSGKTISPEDAVVADANVGAASTMSLAASATMVVLETGTCVLSMQGLSVGSTTTITGASSYQATFEIVKLV